MSIKNNQRNDAIHKKTYTMNSTKSGLKYWNLVDQQNNDKQFFSTNKQLLKDIPTIKTGLTSTFFSVKNLKYAIDPQKKQGSRNHNLDNNVPLKIKSANETSLNCTFTKPKINNDLSIGSGTMDNKSSVQLKLKNLTKKDVL